MKITVREEDRPEAEWFEQAQKQTMETLPAFMRHLMEDYEHDYGTICHAISACAIAAAHAADSSPAGGITGFQAGFIMWDFVKVWSYPNNKLGMRLINMDDLLYPQNEKKFTTPKISAKQFARLQELAKQNLESKEYPVHPSVKAHWESIVAGQAPFGIQVEEESGK